MPKIDIDTLEARTGTGYPPPYDAIAKGRTRKRLGDAGGLTQFGVNLTTLAPGSATAHRHWHANEDEFVLVLSGEAVLIEEDGETLLKAGDAAAFKAGVANGHHIVNRSKSEVVLLEVGSRRDVETAEFPDIDLKFSKNEASSGFTRKDGTAY